MRGGPGRVALGLHRIDAGEQLPGPHPIALGDRQADDLAHRAGPDVRVAGGDNLTRG
jgi:hypothetical protein